MANIQNQKTASGGSVAGSWNEPSAGSRGGAALLATMRACPKPRRRSSRSRLPAACSRTSLLLFRERPSSYTFSGNRLCRSVRSYRTLVPAECHYLKEDLEDLGQHLHETSSDMADRPTLSSRGWPIYTNGPTGRIRGDLPEGVISRLHGQLAHQRPEANPAEAL